jgi:replication-associated recombination protein RarA
LQKSIRRGLVDDSAYWACELMEGYHAYLWRRLKVILSEDIGIAEPHLPATIHSLYQTAEQQRSEKGEYWWLTTLHAVILMARAKKSALVSNALAVHTFAPREAVYRDPPDVALDQHTKRGRQMGRGQRDFFEEGGLLADPETGELTIEGSIPDPFLEKARALLEGDQTHPKYSRQVPGTGFEANG